jgi:hypothetical protein
MHANPAAMRFDRQIGNRIHARISSRDSIIKILLAARRGIDRPLDQNNVVRMHSVEHHFYLSLAAKHPD